MTVAVFALYLALMVGIGLWAARRGTSTQEDYFLGGRGLSSFAVALSAVSSGRSAWLVLGASAVAWKSGLSALWLFPGYIAAEGLMFVTIGPRLRRVAAETGAITISEVFERAAGRDGLRIPVRQLAGVVTILFLLTYVSAQLVAGGKALHAVFPSVDDQTGGLVITAAIVLVYTFLGGYRAVVLTDVVQALLMLGGLVALPILGLVSVGGPGAMVDALRAADPELLSLERGFWPLIGGLAIGLGSFGNPHILVRHMSLAEGSARRAAITGTTWNVVMAAGALLMGLVGRALWPDASAFPGGDVDYLFPKLAAAMSEQYLFAGFVGVLLATLFAAVMSTCDSQLLVVASSLVRDFRGRKQVDASSSSLSGRLTVVASVAVAVAISYGASKQVFPFVLLAWGALGAAFGPTLAVLLYARGTTRLGLAAGLLTGIGVFVATPKLLGTPAGTSSNLHLIWAFAAAAACVYALRRR